MQQAFSPARRQFLRGDISGRHRPLRLPWVKSEALFLDGCTRCGDCLDACPTQIIAFAGGYPQLDFERGQGECTFCGECVDACPAPLFTDRGSAPWSVKAVIDERCLAHANVECRRCEEACEPQAIRFRLRQGGPARPSVSLDDCTGCGACKPLCPTQAIAIRQPHQETS